ncbi:phosphotransferase [Shewanella subflava]|uniref:Phosphotransferase n=1 Tax=Shewanella subflava TaxID=2986476 RepID=A0ABT3I6Q2_9GAMM|nr:phosphotransferase [Shewanella subflava]MCW3171736.1 phosphotransferase [Shewanella subflava]
MASLTPGLKCSALAELPAKVMQLLVERLPADKLSQLSKGCSHVDLLSAGLSNQNFVLKSQTKYGEQAQVLRINHAEAMWCSRVDEVTSWRAAQSIGLAPKLYYCGVNNELYLSEFISESEPWSQFYCQHGANTPRRQQINIDGSTTEPVKQLLTVLQSLATLPLPSKQVSMLQQWQEYQLQLVTDKIPSKQWQSCLLQINQLTDKVLQWFDALDKCLITPSFCHRDLSPFNLLLKTDKNAITAESHSTLMCIDFEYAATSHPLFDLASILATHDLSSMQYESLLDDYFQWQAALSPPYLNEKAKQCVGHAINCYWLFCAMWALIMAKSEPEKFLGYFQQYFALIDSN